MTMLRFATLCLCTALLLPGCKDTDGASAETPAPAGQGSGAAATPTDNPGEPAGTPKPAGPADMVECTPDTRKGGMCTREYMPVCGKKADDARETFPNKCVACSDEKVQGYFAGACEGGETAPPT